MSDAAMLITSDEISASDLASFGESVGAVSVSKQNGSFVMGSGGGNVFVALQDAKFFDLAHDVATIRIWQEKLKSRPLKAIELQLGHDPECYELYLLVAQMLSRKWNVLLLDINDVMVQGEDLEMYATQAGAGGAP